MNKIKVLIDNGFITDNDIHEYISSNQDFYGMSNDEPEYPDYEDDFYDQMINKDYEEQLTHWPDTKYVLASTSQLVQETMVFPSNEEGEITDYGDLACIALRYGHENWENPVAAVNRLNTDEYKYIHIRRIVSESNGNTHNLFMRIPTSDNLVI